MGASPSRTRPRATVARPGSSTTRSGGTNGVSSSSRTVSDGSSASTVPAPVTIAPARARQCCTSRREASPLIHLDSPLASALRPSRLVASLIRSHGRPRSMRERKPRLSARACASIKPDSTVMPAARSLSKPAPSTCGNGSRIAATTRATPAAISASAHGPVRPVWAHGSSDDIGRRAACAFARRRSANTSACGSPARWCQPSPTISFALRHHATDHRVGPGRVERRARQDAARAPSSRGRWR